MIRGSTLIYHSKTSRSRTHFPTTDIIRAYSQRPGLSEELEAVLFPITAIFICSHFSIKALLLSRKTEKKQKNMIAQNREL